MKEIGGIYEGTFIVKHKEMFKIFGEVRNTKKRSKGE